jgi:hypothetical protein
MYTADLLFKTIFIYYQRYSTIAFLKRYIDPKKFF